MATRDVHKLYNRNAGMPKKGSFTDDLSVTESSENLQLLLERLEQVLSLVEPAKEEITHLNERITCNQETSSEKLQSQLFEAKKENAKLLQKLQEMSRGRAELQQANVRIQTLEVEQKEKDNKHLEEIKAFKEVTQRTEELFQETAKKLKETEHLSALHETEFQKKIDIQNQEKSRLTTAVRNLKEERDKLEKELSNTKTRLSKLMSDKLSDNNPDIADLSDENRPTKIGEKYQELYDNQWTDAYEVAENCFTDSDEKTRISVLRKLLMDIHEFCEKEFSEQENALVQALYRTDKVVIDQPPLAIKKQLKDLKRLVAKDGIENITQKFLEGACKSTQMKNFILEVKDFVHECVTICWLMTLQDPPLSFYTDVRNGEVFDSNRYKAFTVTGNRIDFIVWPPLLLQKDGPVLTKGIVQCTKEFDVKSVRHRSRQVTASEMGIPTGSVRLPVKESQPAKGLHELLDSRIHESSDQKVNTTMSEKKSNDSVTATTERSYGSTNNNQDVQTTVGYQKDRELSSGGGQSDYSKLYQSHAANVPQNHEYSHPQQSTKQVQNEGHLQFVSTQSSDPQHQFQYTVAPYQCIVVQQNQPRQPTTTQSVTNERLSSAQQSQPPAVQQPTFSPGNDFRNQQHLNPNSQSLSEYPQHLIPTPTEWDWFVWCMHNMSEANARYNLGRSYDKCKNFHNWQMLKAHNESHV